MGILRQYSERVDSGSAEVLVCVSATTVVDELEDMDAPMVAEDDDV